MVRVEISGGDHRKEVISRKNLPYIVSDQLMSLGEISNVPAKDLRVSIEKMIEGFQKEDELKDNN